MQVAAKLVLALSVLSAGGRLVVLKPGVLTAKRGQKHCTSGWTAMRQLRSASSGQRLPRGTWTPDAIRSCQHASPGPKPDDMSRDVAVDPPKGCEHLCTLIYLHGYSRQGSEYVEGGPLSFCMPWNSGGDRLSCLRAVLPTARCLRQPWGDYEAAWYAYTASNRNHVGDPGTLQETRDRLSRIVHEEVARLEGAGRRVFLGGASQGCTMALDIYLREASWLRLGGFVGSVGFIPSDKFGFSGSLHALERLVADGEQAKMPVWLQCATDDRHAVPWNSVVKPSLRRVEGRLPGLAIRQVSGRGHGIEEWEAHIVNDFLRAYMHEQYTFT